MFAEAAYHMDAMARAEDDVEVALRIDYLDRAVNSAAAASSMPTQQQQQQRQMLSLAGVGGGGAGGGGDRFVGGDAVVRHNAEYLAELEGKRDIARKLIGCRD
jgi:hypothetical protein